MTLTQRQREVLDLLNQGKSVQEIAEVLCIGTGTVIMHQMHLYKKLEVHNRAAALAKARELGLLTEENGE